MIGFEIVQDDIANGKDTNWWELEISGNVKNISPSVWKLTHLTALYLVRGFAVNAGFYVFKESFFSFLKTCKCLNLERQ